VGPTGVEMQALTAAAIAALTLYDMIRETDRSASVGAVRLISASEGRGETWQRAEEPLLRRRPPAGARGAGRISSPPRGRQQPPRR